MNIDTKINNDYIILGSYPQNGTIKEPIKWRILKNENNILTLMSDVILFNGDYDNQSCEYKNSEIRKRILEEFIPNAFTKEEQELILETELEEVTDKVYLPSLEDVKNLSIEERIRKVTPYAFSKNASSYHAYTKKEQYLNGNGWYWTRTPYKPPYDPKRINNVWYVEYNGYVNFRTVWGYDIGIVLMMRIKSL